MTIQRKEYNMLQNLNKSLRKAILIVGAAIVIYGIIEAANEEQKEANDGFQEKEFDDIW
jgi:hypothetical protein